MSENYWIQTYTGKKFDFSNITEDSICIEDIAHALSLTVRFGGHCPKFYSVAEHSVSVSRLVDSKFELHALLHDAAEAYIGDIPKPLKRFFPEEVDTLEGLIQHTIYKKFDLLTSDPECSKQVGIADHVMFSTEIRDYMRVQPTDFQVLSKPLKGPLSTPLDSPKAELQFLTRYNSLIKQMES